MTTAPDSISRCAWCGQDALYQAYHDREWGVPLHDDRSLFELLTLEGAQAGLSWITVLRKRDNYRAAFAGFDPAQVARFGPTDEAALLTNPGIIRNRKKVQATIRNARDLLQRAERYGSVRAYLESFGTDVEALVADLDGWAHYIGAPSIRWFLRCARVGQ